MQKKNSKTVYIAAFLLFAAGLGYLIVSGVSQDSVYFVTVSEALAMDQGKLTQARLFGEVAPERIETAQGSLGVAFDLIDKGEPGKLIRVEYKGAVPDTFKAGVEVIVEGGFDPASKVFTASTLMTKCPSKYKKMSDDKYGATS